MGGKREKTNLYHEYNQVNQKEIKATTRKVGFIILDLAIVETLHATPLQ
jgi:hypothetical protein